MLNHFCTNFSCPNHTNHTIRYFFSRFSLQTIVLNLCSLHNRKNLTAAHQHHHDCIVCYTIRIIKNMCNSNSNLICVLNINMIISNTSGRYILYSDGLINIQYILVHRICNNTECIKSSSKFGIILTRICRCKAILNTSIFTH